MKEFSRYFDSSGKSVWKINGKDVTGKAYLQQVSEYNIQIDNLCQFLPQDRVQVSPHESITISSSHARI